MLNISTSVYDAIIAHARTEHPAEACGIAAGPTGQATRHVPMRNISRHPHLYFCMDPDEQLAVWADVATRGEDIVIVYHSHTARDAYPSHTDIRFASEPGVYHLIVSTWDPDGLGSVEVRAFRINNGTAVEEPVARFDDSPADTPH